MTRLSRVQPPPPVQIVAVRLVACVPTGRCCHAIKHAQAAVQDGLCAAQRAAVTELQRQVPNLHYVTSAGKLGKDEAVAGESAGGIGVHPTPAHRPVRRREAAPVAAAVML